MRSKPWSRDWADSVWFLCRCVGAGPLRLRALARRRSERSVGEERLSAPEGRRRTDCRSRVVACEDPPRLPSGISNGSSQSRCLTRGTRSSARERAARSAASPCKSGTTSPGNRGTMRRFAPQQLRNSTGRRGVSARATTHERQSVRLRTPEALKLSPPTERSERDEREPGAGADTPRRPKPRCQSQRHENAACSKREARPRSRIFP